MPVSVAEHLTSVAPQVRVVKAVNTMGAEVLADPAFPEGPALLLVAGDDADAVATVEALATSAGFDVAVLGGLEEAATVEAVARAWITLAMRRGLGRSIAFRLARR